MSETTPQERMAQLEARLAGIEDYPFWSVLDDHPETVWIGGMGVELCVLDHLPEENAVAFARFIANARDDIEWLRAQLAQAREEIDDLKTRFGVGTTFTDPYAESEAGE